VHELLLAELNSAGKLDLSRAVIDSSHLRALKTAQTGPSPVDRRPTWLETPPDRRRGRRTAGRDPDRRQPQRRHPTDRADRSDPTHPRCSEPPRRRPERIHADRAYDHDKYRRLVRCRRITPSRDLAFSTTAATPLPGPRSSPAVANPTVPALLEDHTGLIRMPFQPTSFAVKLVEVMPVAHVTIDARLTRRGDARLCVRSPRWS
jgi:hypothetical protein